MRPEYDPPSSEIWRRGEAIQWMNMMGWPEDVQDAIMRDDCPDIETVRRLCYSKGPDEAYNTIRKMLYG